MISLSIKKKKKKRLDSISKNSVRGKELVGAIQHLYFADEKTAPQKMKCQWSLTAMCDPEMPKWTLEPVLGLTDPSAGIPSSLPW